MTAHYKVVSIIGKTNTIAVPYLQDRSIQGIRHVMVNSNLLQFMSTGTMALLLKMGLDGDHTLLAHVKQFQKNLYLLSQLRHFMDTPKRKLFYHAHISPHLTYASTVCDGCSDILFDLILFTEELQMMISYSFFNSRYKATVLWTTSTQRKAHVQ